MLAQFVAVAMLAASASDSVSTDSLTTYPEAPGSAVTGPTHPPVRAVRLSAPIQIDGVLNEAVWQNGESITSFTQRDPDEGIQPSQRTEVRIAFDDDAIYVGARLYDSQPDSIMSRLARRDVSIPADRFSFYLDPYHDRRSGYYFMVNAAGTLYDGTLSNDGWEDSSWDGVWNARSRRDEQGWTAEMRIPFSQLRFQNIPNNVWGVNFRRVIQRRSEEVFLVYQPKQGSGFVSRFPDLVGLDGLHAGRSLEIIPYVTGKADYTEGVPGDPFNEDGSAYNGDAGADLRASVGSKLTLNATVNPDFGQVEVDPAVVNLSDFETFYPEKRPFFVEGSANFRFGNEGANDYWNFNWPEPTFFYSRRIGRAPQTSADVSDTGYVDEPAGTTILGAAKLTGKLGAGWNLGSLVAVTAKEEAQLAEGDARFETEVEPFTTYGAIRTQKEFKGRQHGLGFMVNGAVRSFDDVALESQLNRSSLMYGLDGWHFIDKKQTWVLSGWFSGSTVTGTTEQMSNVQQNPRHYFQRPDVDYLGVDTQATSLSGMGGRVWLNKQNGPVIFNGAIGAITPKFDVNDVGFMSRADVTNAHVAMGYKWTEPTKHRKFQQLQGALFGGTDFGGTLTTAGIWGGGFTEFQNNWSWEYSVAYNPTHRYSNRLSRGGPYVELKPGYELNNYIDTDGKAKLFYYLVTNTYQQPESDSWNAYIEPGFEWKPVSNFIFRIGPSLERVVEDAHYVDTQADPTATMTYGNRYVFATLNQTTVAANIRLSMSITPNVSVQFYGQPLVSSGDYSRVKELARGRSYDFNVYGQDGSELTYVEDGNYYVIDPDGLGPAPAFALGNPDFNFTSLRGNAVFRWEYRPGSTFFLVWTNSNSDQQPYGDTRIGDSWGRLTEGPGENIFLAKVTYYLGM